MRRPISLAKILERYRDRWDQKNLADLAEQLRDFATSLNKQKGGKTATKG
jgi:hypothetical protein